MSYGGDGLTETVIASIIEVHRTLGSGFLEHVYRRALVLELRSRGLSVETEKEVEVLYKGDEVGRHRLDIVVDGERIIELKTVERLGRAHYAQLRSYLKATGISVGLLVNFSTPRPTTVGSSSSPEPPSPHLLLSPHLRLNIAFDTTACE